MDTMSMEVVSGSDNIDLSLKERRSRERNAPGFCLLENSNLS